MGASVTVGQWALPGYEWVTDLKPVCGWCGWTPRKPYPSTRRAQEGIQGHEANTSYGCRTARTGSPTPPVDRERRQQTVARAAQAGQNCSNVPRNRTTRAGRRAPIRAGGPQLERILREDERAKDLETRRQSRRR